MAAQCTALTSDLKKQSPPHQSLRRGRGRGRNRGSWGKRKSSDKMRTAHPGTSWNEGANIDDKTTSRTTEEHRREKKEGYYSAPGSKTTKH